MMRSKLLVTSLVCFFFLLVGCNKPDDPGQQQDAVKEASADALFELIPPESSGINFMNIIQENHRVNVFSMGILYNGGGVGVLDYNQDGLQDIFFVSNRFENKLYRNEGNFSFTDVTATAGVASTGGYINGVAIADLNADGLPDIYLSRHGVNNAEIGKRSRTNQAFINQGNGTFREMAKEIGLDSNRPSTQAYFFDADRDGDLDCYLINTPTVFKTSNTMRVYKGPNGELLRNAVPDNPWESDQFFRNDSGRFVDVSDQAGIFNRAFGLSATVHDFNDDGWLDIYVGNDYIEPDMLYINQKDGTFRDMANDYFRHTSHFTMGTDVGDINNDGRMDLVSLDMLAEKNRRRKELDTTMRPDRFNTLVRYGYGYQQMRNMLQLNLGNQEWSEIGSMSGIDATDWSWAALLADYDHDGWTDLYISNGYRYDVMNMDYLVYVVDSINALGGINKTNFPDYRDYLKLMPSEKIPNYLYRNRGDLTFENVTEAWGVSQPSYSSGAVYVDLDNDGDLDLVVSNSEEPAFVYRNTSDSRNSSGNYLQIKANGPRGNAAGYGLLVEATYSGKIFKQQLMPIRGFLSTTEPIVQIGLGEVEMIDELRLTWPDGKVEIRNNVAVNKRIIVDYTAANTTSPKGEGGNVELLVSAGSNQRGLNYEHQENTFDDFNREFLLPWQLSREGPGMAVADVNGDQLDDVFVGGAAGQKAALFLQNQSGQFVSQVWEDGEEREDVGATFFDADGDGDQDLYIVAGGNVSPAGNNIYQDALYLNNGNGGFSNATANLPAIRSSGSCGVPVDIDGDGDLDIIVGGRTEPGNYPNAPRSYLLLNDGNGKFSDQTEAIMPELKRLGMVTDIAVGDLNGNGTNEVAVLGEWMPISVFSRQGSQYRLDQDQFDFSDDQGIWHSIELADFNQDGKLDIVAGNQGQNNGYRLSKDYPLRLYAADFDNNNQVDPIIAYFEDGQLYPYKNRMFLSKQLPNIKRKFPRNQPFAVATMSEIFGEDGIQRARILEANDLNSAVFMNADGGFKRQNLPPLAQIAPVKDILPKDIDQDGDTDLVLVGNDHGVEVETGRIDAGNGLVLLNDGKSNWTVLDNQASGFWANQDARAVLPLRLVSGNTGLVVANNNSVSEFFLLQKSR